MNTEKFNAMAAELGKEKVSGKTSTCSVHAPVIPLGECQNPKTEKAKPEKQIKQFQDFTYKLTTLLPKNRICPHGFTAIMVTLKVKNREYKSWEIIPKGVATPDEIKAMALLLRERIQIKHKV